MSAVTERVAAGAAFLDENDPQWWREDVDRAIDLEALDLGDDRMCVLGQRCPLEVLTAYHGTGENAWAVLERDSAYFAYGYQLCGAGTLLTWAHERGFTALLGLDEFEELTAEWARVIRERRAAAVAS